jgi:hypothetical protein
MNKAIRVYLLNLYGRTRNWVKRKATVQYVIAATDDGAALEAASALHAKVISRAAFVELMNDRGGQIASWIGGVAQGAQSPASARADACSPAPPDIQWSGSKASHWAQTRSFMFRMVRVASISGR